MFCDNDPPILSARLGEDRETTLGPKGHDHDFHVDWRRDYEDALMTGEAFPKLEEKPRQKSAVGD